MANQSRTSRKTVLFFASVLCVVQSFFVVYDSIASCEPWPDSFLTEVFQLVLGGSLAIFHKSSNTGTSIFTDLKCFTALPVRPVKISVKVVSGRALATKGWGLGREQPTLFLTNHADASPRDLIMNYARRNGIEDGLGTNVNFFHMDNLSSEVRLNVDLDVTLTVIANGCYRWLASKLKEFEKAKPKQLSRKFVETSGVVEVMPNRTLRVTLDRRSHNPILREAALDKDSRTIAWLKRYRIEFDYR